jgi:hypothetical protein
MPKLYSTLSTSPSAMEPKTGFGKLNFILFILDKLSPA